MFFIFNIKKSALPLSSNISLFDLLFCSFVLIKTVLIFQVSKKLSKKSKLAKNNRKRTAITLHQKNFNYRKKKIESIGPGHYRIVLSHRI